MTLHPPYIDLHPTREPQKYTDDARFLKIYILTMLVS
jgi:hypothetical protein